MTESNPKLVLLFSGKRKSGKDYITDRLQVECYKIVYFVKLALLGTSWR